MAAIGAIIGAFFVGFILRRIRWQGWNAWLASCMVVPGFVLFAEFVLPYQGGGASMWPIAMFFGGIYGALAGAFGVLVAWQLTKNREQDT